MSSLARSASIALALAFCSCRIEDGNGRIVTQDSVVAAFSKVAVEDGFQVSIFRGEPRLSLTTDENLLGFFVFDVDGDTLKLRRVSSLTIKPTGTVLVEISNPVLEGLAVTGGSQVSADATATGDWRLTVKDGSTVSLSRVETQQLRVEASGSSRVDVFGIARDVRIKSSDASQVNTDGVSAANVTVNASGGSQVNVNASQSAKINASGGSQVSVTGDPPVRSTDSTGGSQVNFFNQ